MKQKFRSLSACVALGVVGLCLGLSLTRCATLASPSADYRSYIESHTETERQFDRGRMTFAIKALAVTPTLFHLQEQLRAGWGVLSDPQTRRVIVGINKGANFRFTLSDLRFTLGGRPSTSIKEIIDPTILKDLYFFADPYYRVFVVTFSAPESGTYGSEDLVVSRITPALTVPVDFGSDAGTAEGTH